MKYTVYLAVFIFLALLENGNAQFSFQIPARSSEVELIPVSIQGAGVNAGTYYVPPALRVFDIVRMASPDNTPNLHIIDSRSVTINCNDSTQTIDLLKFASEGDYSQNPFITPGMTIHLRYAVDFVHIHGELRGTIMGKVPIRRSETAAHLLSLYTFTSKADSANIVITRKGENSRRYSFHELSRFELKHDDFISVLPKKNIPRHATVRIRGEVAIPGVYLIEHGSTTLEHMLSKAGGASPNGDINRAYIIRRSTLFNNPAAGSFLSGQNHIRPEVSAGLNYLSISGDHTIIPAYKRDTPLEDGDEIVVPVFINSVYVSGYVKNPGAFPYDEEKSLGDYIELAGGFSRSADKRNVKLVTPYTDQAFSINYPLAISAGDIIMVPQAQEDKWIRRWTPVIGAVATMISSISIIISLTGR
ncbi:polysaccharide export protein [Chitinispirillum alkaliphilum]|nr:polysaccharide export protein [Chitinispirillum alkaliphilum]